MLIKFKAKFLLSPINCSGPCLRLSTHITAAAVTRLPSPKAATRPPANSAVVKEAAEQLQPIRGEQRDSNEGYPKARNHGEGPY